MELQENTTNLPLLRFVLFTYIYLRGCEAKASFWCSHFPPRYGGHGFVSVPVAWRDKHLVFANKSFLGTTPRTTLRHKNVRAPRLLLVLILFRSLKFKQKQLIVNVSIEFLAPEIWFPRRSFQEEALHSEYLTCLKNHFSLLFVFPFLFRNLIFPVNASCHVVPKECSVFFRAMFKATPGHGSFVRNWMFSFSL